MAFEGITDRLKEQWAELSAKIQETSAYNNAREKFESQSPTVQKAIIAGMVALAVIFILSFPYSYLSDSSDHLTQFEENRDLVQGLLKASRSAKEASPIPPPIDPASFRMRIDGVLRDKMLVPDQIGDIQAIPGSPAKDLAPAGVVQNGLAVQLKQLNLTQIVDLANAMQNLGPGTKLIGLEMSQTAGQTHYYDLILKVVNLGLPMIDLEMEAPTGGQGARGGGSGKGPPKPSKASEGEEE